MKYYLAIDCRLFDYQTPMLVSCPYIEIYQYSIEFYLGLGIEWIATRFSGDEKPYKPTDILLYLQTLNNLKLIQ